MSIIIIIIAVFTYVAGCDMFREDVGEKGAQCSTNNTCREGFECISGVCFERGYFCEKRECGESPLGDKCGTCSGATDFCTSAGLCEEDIGGIAWIPITGGSYMMGSNSGFSDEVPVHQVTVPTFEMTQTEVTVAQYEACVNAGACSEPDTGTYYNWNVSGREDHPVNGVDWNQAVSFCAWAGGRLPSEAEWEYAARSGGQDITYPWGNETPTCEYCVMGSDEGSGCGENRTWSVCSKTLGNTDQGLCDMAGNVYEWVQDCFHISYDEAPSDGSAWEAPAGSSRVFRGGGWSSGVALSLRASDRYRGTPSGGDSGLGFRCARLP